MQNGGGITCQHVRNYRTIVAFLVIAVLVLTAFLSIHSGLLSDIAVSAQSAVVNPAKFRSKLARSRAPKWLNGSANIDVKPTGFAVDTPSCRIPDFDAFNPSISLYIRDPNPQFVICNHSLPITFTDRQYIRLNTTLVKSLSIQHCLYQQVMYAPHLYKLGLVSNSSQIRLAISRIAYV